MTDTLTQIIAKVQNLLGDATGTYFTTALVTAAARQALSEYNTRAPNFAAALITGVADQYEYELSDEDANACQIIDVLRQGTTPEVDVSIDYDEYIEDERVFFRLRRPVTTSDTLIVRYTTHHTVSGLDSATESTLTAKDDQTLVDGACYFSIIARATARVEANNLDRLTSDNYRQMAAAYGQAFIQRLAQASKYRKSPVGEPDTRAWNDKWYGWRK